MSRWASNTTWHELKGAETPQNSGKRACHVALGGRHVAMGLQHDVARAQIVRIPPEREQSERAMSHWECATSRWASNTTWLEPQGSESPRKRAKRVRHVALGGRHVALGLQRDVARASRVRIRPKESKMSAPCRIGRSPCRVGPPTRCGSHMLDSIIL